MNLRTFFALLVAVPLAACGQVADLDAVPQAKVGCETPTEAQLNAGDTMLPGRNCMSCHVSSAQAKDEPLGTGGTVYGARNTKTCNTGGVDGVTVDLLARRRAAKLERQLPDILLLLASSLSTGFSLPQAMDAVAKDVSEPAAKEFARVIAETRIGSDLESALERMAVRMDSDNMRWTSMAIGIQRQVGGNLAETLRTTAATLREREYLRRHVRALSAEGRLSAYILIALPIALFVYEVNVNRSYISLLWTTVLGWIMLVGAVILMAIGVFWMSKAVKVEV